MIYFLFSFIWLISDINHAPIITNLPLVTPVSVAENGALGATVYQVSVSDQNSLDKHTYTATFNPGIYANYLVMNSNSKYRLKRTLRKSKERFLLCHINRIDFLVKFKYTH